MYYTRNTDPTYYYKFSGNANCGSFALRLNEWYDPEPDSGDVYNWILDMACDYSDEEIANIYVDIIADRVMEDFGDKIELCDGRPPKTSDKELIALATFCYYDEEEIDCDWDFHFKVYRDGIWQQKNGCLKPSFCERDEWGKYNSDVIYFYHQIGESDEL